MPTEPIPQVPGLDLADAMKRLDLSFDEFKELLAVFPDAVRTEMAKLEAASGSGDPSAIRSGAHSLAGLAGNYGAKALWMAGKELESAAREGRPQETPALMGKIRLLAAEACAGAETLLR